MKRALLLLTLLSCSAPPPRHLEHTRRITDSVYSGAQPEGDEAFRELASMGVKTLISVDGLKPDVAAAHRHGLRYVHLPIGYDGVPHERALELAKAIQELRGPVYVHCHHGQHRGPTAAVVACVVAGKLDNDEAVAAMKELGTGPQYLGLWKSAREAKAASASELRDLKVEFRETSPIPPMVDAMVGLDAALDRLELCRKAGWTPPPGHPDVDPPHEALKVHEIFVEILRTEECRGRPEEFCSMMQAARAAAEQLNLALGRGVPGDVADHALAALQKSCTDCHAVYRNKARR